MSENRYSTPIAVVTLLILAIAVAQIVRPHSTWLMVGVLVIAVFVSVGLILRARSMALQLDSQSAIDDLTEFRQMREEGKIDEDEFRRLKKVVSGQALAESATKQENKD